MLELGHLRFYYVYIIRSQTSERFYTGMTHDFSARLMNHNEGKNRSTRGKGPWERVWLSEGMEKSNALKLERKIKKRGAARYLTDLRAI